MKNPSDVPEKLNRGSKETIPIPAKILRSN